MSELNTTATQQDRHLQKRRLKGQNFKWLTLSATVMGILVLTILLVGVIKDGLPYLTGTFLESFPSRTPSKAGFFAAIMGSLWCIVLTALFSVPLGVGAGIYLQEYAKKGRLHNWLDLLIANLAGAPSIIYGMLGLITFVRMFDAFGDNTSFLGLPLPFGRSVLAGALTLSLLVVPVIIITTREALRAVPDSLRQAAFGLGATPWQCASHHVLPAALPGIMTGVILALSRALGETAPLILAGALTYVAFAPQSIADPFTAMPIQIFNWASRPQPEFHSLAAAGIVVLLSVLLGMNAVAILLRNRAERRKIS